MKIKELPVGMKGKVEGFVAGAKAYRKHLLALGLTPGTEFTLRRVAPLGDPVELELRGCAISLRKDEADIVKISSLQEG